MATIKIAHPDTDDVHEVDEDDFARFWRCAGWRPTGDKPEAPAKAKSSKPASD